MRYTTSIKGKLTTWRVTANNVSDVHYRSTLGPGSITGQGTGSYLGHLGEPRLITASMRFDCQSLFHKPIFEETADPLRG